SLSVDLLSLPCLKVSVLWPMRLTHGGPLPCDMHPALSHLLTFRLRIEVQSGRSPPIRRPHPQFLAQRCFSPSRREAAAANLARYNSFALCGHRKYYSSRVFVWS